MQNDEIDFDVALAASSRPSDFELKMKTFRRRSTMAKKVVMDEPPAVKPIDATTTLGGLSTGFDFLGGGQG